jgi:hypothetical protein
MSSGPDSKGIPRAPWKGGVCETEDFNAEDAEVAQWPQWDAHLDGKDRAKRKKEIHKRR